MKQELTENLENNKELEKLSINDIMNLYQIKIDYSKDSNEKKELESLLELIKVNNRKDDYFKTVIQELHNQSGKSIGMIKELLEIIQHKDKIIDSNAKYSNIQNMNYFELMFDFYESLNKINGNKNYSDIDSAFSNLTNDYCYSEFNTLFMKPESNIQNDYSIHCYNDFKDIAESDKELLMNIFDDDDSDINDKLELLESILTKDKE